MEHSPGWPSDDNTQCHLTSAMDRDLATIEADLPQTVTIGGVSYACIAGAVQEGEVLGDVGFSDTASVAIIVRQALFGSAIPRKNMLLTLNSGGSARVLRVDQITPGEDGLTYTLNCVDPTK